MDITRSRLDRMLFIDSRIRKGDFPNANVIAREWADRIGSSIPVDRKTIQRDIDYLRDMHRAPIVFSHVENGFYYAEESWKLPFGIQLTEGEMLALLLAKQMSAMYKNTPVEEYLEGLFSKIRDALGGTSNIDPSIIDEQVSFHSHPSRPINEKIWKMIFTALRDNIVLKISYQGLNDDAESDREVEPFHMANVDDDWYMVGHCRKSNARRHFSISRIQSAKLTNKRFLPHDDFDPDLYFANRFGKFIAQPDSKTYDVILMFSPDAAPRVLERTWHPKQEFNLHKNGGVSLRLPLPSLIEAKRFCLGWGKEVEVMHPPELRNAIHAEGVQMAAKHSNKITYPS